MGVKILRHGLCKPLTKMYLRRLITMRSHRWYDIITIYIIILLFLCVQFSLRGPLDVELGLDRLTVHRFLRFHHVYA